MFGPLSVLAAAACLAAPVHGRTVHAGPFVGYLLPKYDVVGGRFRLHVGDYRDRKSGLSQKIGWLVPARYHVSQSLVVSGRRLNAPGAFTQEFALAMTSDTSGHAFATDINPPTAGCWGLTFVSGKARGTLTVLVSG